MTKQDYNSVRGLNGQAQETKGSKQRTLLRSKWYSQNKKKKKEAVWSWVGGSQEYISTKVPISLIHTHTQPASVSAETKDTNTDDRMHAPHSRSKSLVRNTTRPKVLTASLTGGQ